MLASLSYSEKQELLQLLEEQQRRKSRNKLAGYKPYRKQAEFHAAGANNRERLFMAGNQLGKTLAGGAEWAYHLTGKYPDWWEGKRFDKPVRMWAAGETGKSTRETVQTILVGNPERPEEWGTGMIPGDCILGTSLARGVPNSLDSVSVSHVSGGISSLLFKSYEQGRRNWQGPTLEGVWFDEEPPADIYSEGLTRTNATGGVVIVTFTPLLGMSNVVMLFLTAEQINMMLKGSK